MANTKCADSAVAVRAVPTPQVSQAPVHVTADAMPADATVVDPVPEDINRNELKADKIIASVAAFHSANPHSPTMTLSVEPDVWQELKIKYADQVEYKLDYIASSNEITVTWATTWVHENFDMILGPFKRIASADPQHYRCLFNKNLSVFESPDEKSDLTPDFAFSRNTAGTWEHLIILECAASQKSDDLLGKVKRWLKEPSVRLVVGIDIKIGEYRTPAANSRPEKLKLANSLSRPIPDRSAFHTMPFPPLGPIELYGHKWAQQISHIEVGLYGPPDDEDLAAGRTYTEETFDITPHGEEASDHDKTGLAAALDVLTDVMQNVIKEIVGVDLFDRCFGSDTPFNLRWKDFTSNLSSALRDDAFDRFADYFKIPSIRVTPPTGSTFKRALSKVDKEKMERARKRQKN